jgi:hypothetical protein
LPPPQKTPNKKQSHLRQHADAVVVVEEYDKLDCAARSMWRQLLQRPQDANVSTLQRAVVLLESNLGMSELEGMLSEGVEKVQIEEGESGGRKEGGADAATAAVAAAVAEARSRASAEEAERRLRDAVFARWRRDGCEAYEDTLKLVSLVDFFLPYFPLERRHVDELIGRALKERARAFAAAAARRAVAEDDEDEDEEEEEEEGGEEAGACVAAAEDGLEVAEQQHGGTFWPPLAATKKACARGSSPPLRLAWRPPVVRFLSSRVEFSGPFPLEGAKGVESAVTRHVARLLRRASEALAARRRERRRLIVAAAAKARGGGEGEAVPIPPPLPDTLLLFVAPEPAASSSSGTASQDKLKAELMTEDEARARMAREAAAEQGEEEEEEQAGACAAAAADCAAAATAAS